MEASGIEYGELIERRRNLFLFFSWHLNIHIRLSMVYYILIKIRCCFVGPAIGSGACPCVFVEKPFQNDNDTPWMSWFCVCAVLFLVLFEPRIIILLTGMVMVSIGWVALWLFWHLLKVIAKFEFRLSHESIYSFILIQWIVKVPSPRRCSKLELNKQLH